MKKISIFALMWIITFCIITLMLFQGCDNPKPPAPFEVGTGTAYIFDASNYQASLNAFLADHQDLRLSVVRGIEFMDGKETKYLVIFTHVVPVVNTMPVEK